MYQLIAQPRWKFHSICIEGSFNTGECLTTKEHEGIYRNGREGREAIAVFLTHPECDSFKKKRKVPPACSRADESARSFDGRRDDERLRLWHRLTDFSGAFTAMGAKAAKDVLTTKGTRSTPLRAGYGAQRQGIYRRVRRERGDERSLYLKLSETSRISVEEL